MGSSRRKNLVLLTFSSKSVVMKLLMSILIENVVSVFNHYKKEWSALCNLDIVIKPADKGGVNLAYRSLQKGNFSLITRSSFLFWDKQRPPLVKDTILLFQIAVLKRMKMFPFETRIKLYQTFIVLHLNYCAESWHFCSKRSADKLEKMN